jgi:hypothetical protein
MVELCRRQKTQVVRQAMLKIRKQVDRQALKDEEKFTAIIEERQNRWCRKVQGDDQKEEF